MLGFEAEGVEGLLGLYTRRGVRDPCFRQASGFCWLKVCVIKHRIGTPPEKYQNVIITMVVGDCKQDASR